MTQLMAFTKKEWMEMLRTGKFAIITVLFILSGVMNPAIAVPRSNSGECLFMYLFVL